MIACSTFTIALATEGSKKSALQAIRARDFNVRVLIVGLDNIRPDQAYIVMGVLRVVRHQLETPRTSLPMRHAPCRDFQSMNAEIAGYGLGRHAGKLGLR